MTKLNFINTTPHTINITGGASHPPVGVVVRVSSVHSEFDADGICIASFGEVSGLPQPKEGVRYIVSKMVLDASERTDLVAPATSHPGVVRNDKGHIVSVPGFVRS